MARPKPKYRPSLTAEEVAYLTRILKQIYLDSNSSESLALLQKFSVLETKIANNAITPSHIEKPKVSLIEQLGGTQPSLQLTKEEYWEQCYTKYRLQPEECSVSEIDAAKEHMYLNDLMTPEQIAEFETKMMENL